MDKNTTASFFKKYWKIIVSFVLIFSILGAAYFFIENVDPTQKPVETPSTPLVPLLSLDASLIARAEITNASGTLTFMKDENAWLVKDIAHVELIQERVESLVYSAATLSATRCIVTNATDMGVYGLQTPQATVKLMNVNGAEHVFYIGNITPAGDGYYACLKDSRDVYMLATGAAGQFFASLDAFREMTVTSLYHTQIRNVTIHKDGTEIRLQYVAPPEGAYPGSVSTWQMETPLNRPAGNDTVLKQILSPVSDLVAVAVAEDNPKDLSKYGFDGDWVSVKTETESVKFSVGQKDGVYYIMPDGKATVYLMGTSLSFMEVTPFELAEKETNLIPLDTVSKIELTLPGVSATLLVETEGEEMKFSVNGKAAEEDKFKYLYMEIAGLSVDGIAQSPKASGTPAASIVYTLVDGSETTLKYYPYDGLNYALYENGECTFYIKKTRIANLADSLRSFL